MTIDRIVLMFIGAMALTGTLLAWLVSPWWLLLTGFVGVNMLQASVTGFCPLAMVLKAMGVKSGVAFS